MSEPLCVLSCTTVVQNYLYSVPLCEQFLPMAGGLNLGFVGLFAYFLDWSQFSCVGLVFLLSFCFFGGADIFFWLMFVSTGAVDCLERLLSLLNNLCVQRIV